MSLKIQICAFEVRSVLQVAGTREEMSINEKSCERRVDAQLKYKCRLGAV